MEEIQSENVENQQTGTIAKKQQINVQKIPLKDSINDNGTKDSEKQIFKKQIKAIEKQIQQMDDIEFFEAASNELCFCNGQKRRNITSNFYDLTPSAEFAHVLDVTSNPSKMFHLLMNDPNYAALFDEKDLMEELNECETLMPRPEDPVESCDDDDHAMDVIHKLDVTPLDFPPIDIIDIIMPVPEEEQNPATNSED